MLECLDLSLISKEHIYDGYTILYFSWNPASTNMEFNTLWRNSRNLLI